MLYYDCYRVKFIFRQPPLSFVQNIFTLPFSRAVWVGSAALIAVIGFVLFHALKWENRMRPVSWSDVLLLSVGVVCQQGSQIDGKGIPGRITMIFLFVIVIFLYTSYSAYVVALLQSTTTSIRSLTDLLESGLTLGAHDITYNRQYMKNVSDSVRKAIYTQRISPPGGPERFYSMAEGLDRVRRGLFAFHLEQAAGYKIISDTYTEDEKCNLQTMNFLIEIPDPWVTINKHSPYREIVAMGYRMVHERGFQYRENHRFYYWKPECSSRGTNFVSVGIIDCYSALLMLVFGMLAAMAILFVEVIVQKKLYQKLNVTRVCTNSRKR
ncbi:hypothetical protein L9F63_021375 [Diploptera punctata]|uniref:Ionotropic glutamate receptor C-terminal domain-containing protein n=1 Tax=Diploptera punctata TaxID=6984 RepID=A0AAD8EC01_DIPPU|nr:hypothetical protein L9F63_021375 [Diploptera punctata]